MKTSLRPPKPAGHERCSPRVRGWSPAEGERPPARAVVPACAGVALLDAGCRPRRPGGPPRVRR
ncbi:hypothetical protein DBP19_19340 [Streptomyces sp. CS090A]|nr:hypothetical protein DBP19_19340 [Streptomyces sp. CS090A]